MVFRKSGYSLLEMLVVLAIISLLTAVVLPSLSVSYDSWQWRNLKEDVIQEIRLRSISAYREGTEYRTGNMADHADLLPEGVALLFEPELVITDQGICRGSELTISYKTRVSTLHLEPPYCNVSENHASTQ